ncbi:MAG: hypothetical protein IJV13_00405 [Prevotella sp.]|nr:hypothetical protein [Prevotella sp.]MBQ9650670.1 hypothetical protein [Prevotella sp.]
MKRKIEVWGARILCDSFEEARYYNGNRQEIKVRGLKTFYEAQQARFAKLAEKFTDPITKMCVASTGMTPEQYQLTHHRAWNE